MSLMYYGWYLFILDACPNCWEDVNCNWKVNLSLILLTWRIWWAPNNARKWQMGFNLVFKGLNWNNFELRKCRIKCRQQLISEIIVICQLFFNLYFSQQWTIWHKTLYCEYSVSKSVGILPVSRTTHKWLIVIFFFKI
jgi:hypothetical protein